MNGHHEIMVIVFCEQLADVAIDRAAMFAELHEAGVHIDEARAATMETSTLAGHVKGLRAAKFARCLLTLAMLSGVHNNTTVAIA